MIPLLIGAGIVGATLWALSREDVQQGINSLLDDEEEEEDTDGTHTPAEIIMRRENKNALIGREGAAICMLEDWADPDGRIYRLEYQSTPDGRHAWAYCRSNPWDRSQPNAGTSQLSSHVASNGFLCLGDGSHCSALHRSPYDLLWVIQRARFWCTAFSVLKETGQFPNN